MIAKPIIRSGKMKVRDSSIMGMVAIEPESLYHPAGMRAIPAFRSKTSKDAAMQQIAKEKRATILVTIQSPNLPDFFISFQANQTAPTIAGNWINAEKKTGHATP